MEARGGSEGGDVSKLDWVGGDYILAAVNIEGDSLPLPLAIRGTCINFFSLHPLYPDTLRLSAWEGAKSIPDLLFRHPCRSSASGICLFFSSLCSFTVVSISLSGLRVETSPIQEFITKNAPVPAMQKHFAEKTYYGASMAVLNDCIYAVTQAEYVNGEKLGY